MDNDIKTEEQMSRDYKERIKESDAVEEQALEKGVPVSEKARESLEKKKIMTGIQVEADAVMNEMAPELMSPYYEDAALQEVFVKATSLVKYDGVSIEDAAREAYQGMVADLGK